MSKILIEINVGNTNRHFREQKRRSQQKHCIDCNEIYTKGTFYAHRKTHKHELNVLKNMKKFIDEEEPIFKMDEENQEYEIYKNGKKIKLVEYIDDGEKIVLKNEK